MPPPVLQYRDPRLFADAVMGQLLQSEAAYCGHISLIKRLAEKGHLAPSPADLCEPLMLSIADDSSRLTVAVQTIKRTMLVTDGSPSVMNALAEHLAARSWDGEELIGPSPSIVQLVDWYSALSNRFPRLKMNLRIFTSSAVIWPAPSGGGMRPCVMTDRDGLAMFVAGFAAEIHEEEDDPLATADHLIVTGRAFFWIVDEEPVALACWALPTPNGIRISFVYTPPSLRGRGYASNLVAHLTQHLLNEGRRWCFLLTDQANPISNYIYERIGYRPVCDSEQWRFETLPL